MDFIKASYSSLSNWSNSGELRCGVSGALGDSAARVAGAEGVKVVASSPAVGSGSAITLLVESLQDDGGA